MNMLKPILLVEDSAKDIELSTFDKGARRADTFEVRA